MVHSFQVDKTSSDFLGENLMSTPGLIDHGFFGGYSPNSHLLGGWATYPSEKSWSESQLGMMTFPTEWNTKFHGSSHHRPTSHDLILKNCTVPNSAQPFGVNQAWHYHPMTHGEFTLSSPWAPLLESRHALNHPVTSTESTSRARAKSSPKDIPRNGRKNHPEIWPTNMSIIKYSTDPKAEPLSWCKLAEQDVQHLHRFRWSNGCFICVPS